MKRIILAMAAAAMLAAVPMAAANAVDIHAGPNGVYVGPDHHHHHLYNKEGKCRVVITHHTNRSGNEVTVRRRTCD
jgi:hypothetical protein